MRTADQERERGSKATGADGDRGDGGAPVLAPPTVDPASHPDPPGPAGLPLVGSTLRVAREGVAFGERLRDHGDVVRYDAFGRSFVTVYDPAVVEVVLVGENDRFVKGDHEQAFGDLVAPEGLAFTEGEQWRRQRHLLQSSFTPDRVRAAADEMVTGAATLADGWRDGETVELGGAYSRFTLQVLLRALFDLELTAERGAVVRRAADRLDAYVERFPVLSLLPDWVPTRTERRYEAAMADLTATVDRMVAERRAADADGTGDDLLSLLAAADYPDGGQLSPETVRDQLVTFLFAGHETTATTLAVATWLLAGNPDVAARLRAEADALGGDPTFADLGDLDLTERVVREALRLYPPVYSLYRQATEPLVVGGYRVTPSDTLQLPQYALHRDGRYWDDPEAFDPSRWHRDDRPEYAYFPFGGGPRHCIGMRFAMAELQLVLATLARRLRFERVTDELSPSMGVTLDPGPVRVRVRHREP